MSVVYRYGYFIINYTNKCRHKNPETKTAALYCPCASLCIWNMDFHRDLCVKIVQEVIKKILVNHETILFRRRIFGGGQPTTY